MSDKLYPIPIEKLLKWIFAEEKEGKLFGLYKQNLFIPRSSDRFKMTRYGIKLDTPIGAAAGPHTQMSQNIIAAWLCGARYIELKTVQTLDEIEVTKPCIDMEDEGYNCEWSQELKIQESFNEYLNSWIIIHLLKHKLGLGDAEPGFIFNMSVGYDLQGILKPNVQWFFDKMNDCSIELQLKIDSLKKMYPEIEGISIPSQISNNITLSTMHGCPPNEIEKIGKYLIEEKKLHTAIKLNPTLLGPEKLRLILNEKLGYEIHIPDEAFEHDLKFNDAVNIIKSLTNSAKTNGVEFNLKLTNTLEALNNTRWLPQKERMVYTSGRPLHPISINLAAELQREFNNSLDISFCAGVDVFNVADTLKCNLKPVTVCSDLLKPGGYLRLTQYLDKISSVMQNSGNQSLEEFANSDFLFQYANSVLENKTYHKSSFPFDNIKTERELTEFDCVHAPCTESCAVDQKIPEYLYHTSKGDFKAALDVILEDNPLPNISGNVCDHLCQTKCTRMNYDNPLQIKAIKRFITEWGDSQKEIVVKEKNGLSASIVGAGPSGLSCAYFLAKEGFKVTLYEAKPFAGGMTSDSIPSFRLSEDRINSDINFIKKMGVTFVFDQMVTSEFFDELRKVSDYIFIGVGAQKNKKLNIPGENLDKVIDQLTFLSNVRRFEKIDLGNNVAVIGGGNSAVDAARTAKRLVGGSGRVTVLYRRTQKEMPADKEEIRALIDEGIELKELIAPLSVSKDNGHLLLKCIKMELGKPDNSGRRKPYPIKNSEYDQSFTSIIPAIGQEVVLDFLDDPLNISDETKETQLKNIYAGGDAVRGADSLINAIGDGKKAAESIIAKVLSLSIREKNDRPRRISLAETQRKQSYRIPGESIPEIELDKRFNFDLVHPVLDKHSAVQEASRCLYCDDLCNICVGVCPNFANFSYQAIPESLPIYEISNNDDKTKKVVISYLKIEQGPQIINLGDFCNECGNCNTFCPTSSAPYKTKPKFYLSKKGFEQEDNCYFLFENELLFKKNNSLESLFQTEDYYIYKSRSLCVEINKKDYSIRDIKHSNISNKKLVLNHAATMLFLLKNLKDLAIFK